MTFRARLEDAVAMAFFLFFLVLAVFIRDMRYQAMSPVNVYIVTPAVCLLLIKEMVHYFVSGKQVDMESTGGILDFVRPYWHIVRDWLPFFMLLFMYYTLWGNATHLLWTHDADMELIAWDQRLFGFQASVALQRIISPPLTAWMQFAYFFHLPNIPIVACFVYIRRPRERFREMMTGVLLITVFGLIGYLLVPGIGPMYTLAGQYTVSLDQRIVGVLNRGASFIDFARVQRDVFPSLHVGISFVVWLYAWRNSRRLFWILSPFIVSLWFSCLYLRYHYLVDVVAGLILAPLCYWASNWMFKRFGEFEVPVWLPAGWADRIRRLRGTLSDEKAPKVVKDTP